MVLPTQERQSDVTLTPRQKDAADYAQDPSKYNPFLTRRAGQSLIKDYKETITLPVGYTTTTIIKHLKEGDSLKEISVLVKEVYPPTVSMSLGFPANMEEIIGFNDIPLDTLGSYIYFPHRISEVDETLTLYFNGGPSSSGLLIIFVER